MLIFSTLFFLICFTFPALVSCEETVKGNEFEKLIRKLIDDGFDKEKIEKIFAGKEIAFAPESVSQFFIHSESSLDYDRFTSPKAIESTLKYLTDNQEILDKAEVAFGVDKTIITAILLVETRLGSYLGTKTVINTLSTMAALSDEALRERIWDAIPDGKKPSKDYFIKKAQDKMNWGYNELKALLQYTEKEGIAPESIKGSYAGA
ncbi:MAG: protein MltB, partial [Desulfobacula sp. RIFOXYB2_FULL_45_6]